METPLISVIIPYYQGERFIGETLESIFKQDYKNLEIIVVNDGSSATSLEALSPYKEKITLISQENKGQAAARNLGLKQAKGSFIALVDQDDIWPEDHLSLMLPYLSADKGYDFVIGLCQYFSTDGKGLKQFKGSPLFQPALIGSALYSSSVFKSVGLFDPEMRAGEDFDWNIRLKESSNRAKKLDSVTLLVRKHEANQSSAAGYIQKGQMLSLKKKLDRARANFKK